MGTLENIPKVLEWLKPLPAYLLALFFGGLLLLLSPSVVLRWVGLFEIQQRWWAYIFLATVFLGLILISLTLFAVWPMIMKIEADRKQQQRLISFLHSLTPDEKAALRPYIEEEKTSLSFTLNDGIAGGLEARGIIYRSAHASTSMFFPYNLQPWAREYLKEHPHLLSLESPSLLSATSSRVFKDNSYWVKEGKEERGPYCTLCWDIDSKQVQKLKDETGRWYCLVHEKPHYPLRTA